MPSDGACEREGAENKRPPPQPSEDQPPPPAKISRICSEGTVVAAASTHGPQRSGNAQPMPMVGDLVEAVFSEGCWVPAVVLATRGRQVHVEFEVPEPEPPRGLLCGAHYSCKEDDTIREVARRFGVPAPAVLALNRVHYEGLTCNVKLRRHTLLALPHVLAACVDDTPQSIASAHNLDVTRLVEDNQDYIPELSPSSKLRLNTLLVIPRRAGHQLIPKGATSAMPLLGAAVEVRDVFESHWQRAQVCRILGGLRFSASIEESDGMRDLQLNDEGETWRRPSDPSHASTETKRNVKVGDVIDAEVEENGKTRWRAARVQAIFDDGQFTACIDGDEDFVETYSLEEENTEWRWPPTGRKNAKEWLSIGLIRPRPPRAPSNFLEAAAWGGSVQVLQDGGWWQATVADDALLTKLSNSTKSIGQISLDSTICPVATQGKVGSTTTTNEDVQQRGEGPVVQAASRAEDLTVNLLQSRSIGSSLLRVRVNRIRPDWEFKDGCWRVVPPPTCNTQTMGRIVTKDRNVTSASNNDEAKPQGKLPTGLILSPLCRLHQDVQGLQIKEPLNSWAWAVVGAHAEVRLNMPAARGAWWAVELLELQQQAALVSYEAFAETDGATTRLQEWVPWSRLRPRPPATPVDFLKATQPGELVQLWWEDAWWDAILLEKLSKSSQSSFMPADEPMSNDIIASSLGWGQRDLETVSNAKVQLKRGKDIDSPPQIVACARLRPGWHWRLHRDGSAEGEWAAPCIARVGMIVRDLSGAIDVR